MQAVGNKSEMMDALLATQRQQTMRLQKIKAELDEDVGWLKGFIAYSNRMYLPQHQLIYHRLVNAVSDPRSDNTPGIQVGTRDDTLTVYAGLRSDNTRIQVGTGDDTPTDYSDPRSDNTPGIQVGTVDGTPTDYSGVLRPADTQAVDEQKPEIRRANRVAPNTQRADRVSPNTQRADTLTTDIHGAIIQIDVTVTSATHGSDRVTPYTQRPDTVTSDIHGSVTVTPDTQIAAAVTSATHGPDTVTPDTQGSDTVTLNTQLGDTLTTQAQVDGIVTHATHVTDTLPLGTRRADTLTTQSLGDAVHYTHGSDIMISDIQSIETHTPDTHEADTNRACALTADTHVVDTERPATVPPDIRRTDTLTTEAKGDGIMASDRLTTDTHRAALLANDTHIIDTVPIDTQRADTLINDTQTADTVTPDTQAVDIQAAGSQTERSFHNDDDDKPRNTDNDLDGLSEVTDQDYVSLNPSLTQSLRVSTFIDIHREKLRAMKERMYLADFMVRKCTAAKRIALSQSEQDESIANNTHPADDCSQLDQPITCDPLSQSDDLTNAYMEGQKEDPGDDPNIHPFLFAANIVVFLCILMFLYDFANYVSGRLI